MGKPIDTESIEKYFRGELDAESAEQLKAAVKDNAELREEYEWYRDMSKAVEWQGILDEAEAERRAERNAAAEKRSDTASRPIPLLSRRWMAYAAVGLLFVLVGSFWWGKANYSNGALAQVGMDRLNLKNGSDYLRNTTTIERDPFAQGLEAVQAEEWPAAVEFFSHIADTSALFVPAQLYLAYAQLEQGQYPEAQASAEVVDQRSSDTRQRQKAQWMMVQARVAQGEETNALDLLLDSISQDESHMFQGEALILKRRLNSPWRRLTW